MSEGQEEAFVNSPVIVDGVGVAPKNSYLVASDTPQFVVLSFDGSKDLQMLSETRGFARKMNDEDKPLHFTYFINAAYFLSNENADVYQGPEEKRGFSNIGFSDSAYDINARIQGFNDAVKEGNEVGSHTAGHFIGTNWTYDDWMSEFNSFDNILFTPRQSIVPDLPKTLSITSKDIIGFRAPGLATNDNMYKALRDFHFLYDTSGIDFYNGWPKKDAYGIWRIPLGVLRVGERQTPVVAMDYSIWVLQSGAKNLAVKDTPLWNEYFNEVKDAYMAYFNSNYNGNRAPVIIGGHFSKWNDGVYFEAMKSFAEDVCGKPHVRCVTFRTLVDYLENVGVPEIISSEVKN
ncbi:MAG: hypothetical protein WCT19_04860 [Candidatus Paceibacterota bacterium]